MEVDSYPVVRSSRLFHALASGLLLVSLVLACSDGGSGGSGGGFGGGGLGGGGSSQGGGGATRSATCLKFQDAVCDYAADRCQDISRKECDDTLRSTFCKSDDVIQGCLNALQTATCTALPAACNNVTNNEPAIGLCKQLSDTICTFRDKCGLSPTKNQCLESLAQELPCFSVVGASPNINACFSEISSMSCPKNGQFTIPDSCQGVLKVKTQSTAVMDTPLQTSVLSVGWNLE